MAIGFSIIRCRISFSPQIIHDFVMKVCTWIFVWFSDAFPKISRSDIIGSRGMVTFEAFPGA